VTNAIIHRKCVTIMICDDKFCSSGLYAMAPWLANCSFCVQNPLGCYTRQYSLRIRFRSRLGQRHGLQNTTLTSCFYKKYLWKSNICILLWKYFSRQIYSYNFYICKLINLKVIDDLYSQCLTQILSKMTSKSDTEGVFLFVCLKVAWPVDRRPNVLCSDILFSYPFLESKPLWKSGSMLSESI
jgi:hypothetical protein